MDINDNDKIKIEPIGISYKDTYIKNLNNDLESIAKSMPDNSVKPLKVLCNSHKKQYRNPKSGYRNDRGIMMKHLKDKTDIIDFCNEKHDFSNESIIRTWKKHKDYAFELSPSGNGLDCHRTYEALILKTIPIVRTNTLDPIYLEHDLPVVIVNEWDEVTKDNLEKWHEKYKKYFTDELDKKMRINYWKQYNNINIIQHGTDGFGHQLHGLITIIILDGIKNYRFNTNAYINKPFSFQHVDIPYMKEYLVNCVLNFKKK